MSTSTNFFFSSLKQLSIASLTALILGLALVSSVPYSAGIAQNWFITLAEGYRISFFYALEIVIYISALFIYGFKLKNKDEKVLFVSILLVLLSRVISGVFADKFDKVQVISFFRYVEVFVTLYVLANLLEKKINRIFFIYGLIIGVLIECFIGVFKYVISSGALRGIAIGIQSFQLMILFLFILILFTNYKKGWVQIILAIILIFGIIANGTRGAFLQIGAGAILLLIWKRKSPFIGKIIYRLAAVIIIIIISLNIIPHLFTKISEISSSRMIEVEKVVQNIEANGTVEGTGTIQYRFYLWDKALGAFFHNPITGIGSGGFGRQIEQLPQVFNVELKRTDRNTPLSTHNTLLGVLAETGVIGLIAYAFWIFAVVLIVQKALKFGTEDPIIFACCIMLCVFVMSDAWSQNSFLPNMGFVLGFVLGFLRDKTNELDSQAI